MTQAQRPASIGREAELNAEGDRVRHEEIGEHNPAVSLAYQAEGIVREV